MNKFSNVIGTTPSTTLFIGDLSIVCTASDLEDLFAPYHAVNVEVERDSRFVSFGFVSFASVQQAGFAMHHLNGTMMFGRNLRMGWASKEKGAAVKYLTVDVHFSFIAKQAKLLVFELTVQEVLFELGCRSVVDVEFKSYTVQPNSSQHFGNGFIRLDPSPQSVHMAKRLCTQLKKLSVDGVVVFDFGQGNTLSGLLAARPDLAQLWHSLDASMRSTGMVNHMKMGAELSYASPQQMERFLTNKKVQTSAHIFAVHKPRPTMHELVASNAFGASPSPLPTAQNQWTATYEQDQRHDEARSYFRNSGTFDSLCSSSDEFPSRYTGAEQTHHTAYQLQQSAFETQNSQSGGTHHSSRPNVTNGLSHIQHNYPPSSQTTSAQLHYHKHYEQHPLLTAPSHGNNRQLHQLLSPHRRDTPQHYHSSPKHSSADQITSFAEQPAARRDFFMQVDAAGAPREEEYLQRFDHQQSLEQKKQTQERAELHARLQKDIWW